MAGDGGGAGGGGGVGVIAALYVQADGVYAHLDGVEPWGLPGRDARAYAGPWPVVAHPPCAAWGRYAKPTPESTARGPLLGDDGGCFAAALASVRRWGGVLEHPRDSKAWACGGVLGDVSRALPVPTPGGGWSRSLLAPDEWVCEVEQGHYGHAAQKPTWLFYAGPVPPSLARGASVVTAIGSGARRGNLESLSKRARAATPPEFAAVLVSLAAGSRLAERAA